MCFLSQLNMSKVVERGVSAKWVSKIELSEEM